VSANNRAGAGERQAVNTPHEEMAAIAFPSPELRVASPTTWTTTKAILLQSLGIIYFAAFLAAHYQNEGLMGEHGLMPAHEYFETVQQRYLQSSWWEKFHDYPSIFWFIPLNDDTMHKVNLSGLTLSVLLMLRQGESKLILFLLWLLYFSVVTSAGHTSFYSYGWESQLLETGFLAIMLCDIWILPSTFLPASRKPQSPTHPSPIILWLFRWLCFRISIGAGLIKIRGDSCWTQKTCLLYHFETQPIPSPTSFLFHFLPPIILQRAVDLDLFVQVYTSWMVLLPTHIPAWPKVSTWCLQVVRVGGIIQAAFMVNIIVSGNLGFLPHLTIVPALACLDDACWPDWIQVRKTTKQLHVDNQPDGAKRIRQWPRPRPRSLLNGTFALLILYLSRPVVSNLLQLDGSRQQMNASFDPFRLVNTYGAFGSVGKQRYEPIVSISYDMVDDMNTAVSKDSLQWMELEFPCKPGSIHRRPCFCEPYHCESSKKPDLFALVPYHQANTPDLPLYQTASIGTFGLLDSSLTRPT
jgi:lipase maturation factor 1